MSGMQLRGRQAQRGMSFWSLLVVLAVIAFFAIVGVKVIPLYLNQLKVTKAVHGVADELTVDPANIDPYTLQNALQRRWDIEDVQDLSPKEVKLVRTENGPKLAYDYEARVRLFYNIYVVVDFKDQVSFRKEAD